MNYHARAIDDRRVIAELARPPRRVSVSACAAESVRIETPGGYAGMWDPDLTPYMVEPMDLLKSRRHEAVVAAMPARTGKSQALLDCWLAHCVIADPGDIGLYFPTQALALDYRERRVERMHRVSAAMHEQLSARKHDTKLAMVTYRNGMIASLGWPTSGQLAQRDLRYIAMSDYDSWPDDIGGEGSGFDLGRKRITVAMSAGMALVESSPKRPQVACEWQATGPHEAPPTDGGILALYNRGDRRQWYWQCIDGCGGWWIAPHLPAYAEGAEKSGDPAEAGDSAYVACPHCAAIYWPKDKKRLNDSAGCMWVPEGMTRDRDGVLHGKPRRSKIASFWLRGCAAAFQPWQSIVTNYIQALRERERTGDESSIIATTNTDQGMPYRPTALDRVRAPDQLESRREPMVRGCVPDGARCLFAAVDVQGWGFEVLILAYGRGRERWIVDRFTLRTTGKNDVLRPAAYLEHWDTLIGKVINATCKLADGREMRIRRVGIDSGGEAEEGGDVQTTGRAKEFWARCPANMRHRVRLLKGGQKGAGAVVREAVPDATKTGRSRGDVPVLLLRSDALKDRSWIDLDRPEPGPGYVHIPDWIRPQYLAELHAEVRDPKGWTQVAKRNETWDLLCYCDALWQWEGGERINWDHPPPWAAPWNANCEVITAEQREAMQSRQEATAAPTLPIRRPPPRGRIIR